MRDGWVETILGDVADIYQPKTIAKALMDDSAEYIVYGANGPIGRYHQFNHADREVVVTCRGATCGTINMTPEKTWITGNAMVVHLKSDLLNKQFLFYALTSVVDVHSIISGSAQPQITREGMVPVKISIPPLPEQKRIVDLISSVDSYIEALLQQVESARRSRNAVLHELLTVGGDDWVETTIGDVSTFVRTRKTPSELDSNSIYVGLEHLEPNNAVINNFDTTDKVSSSLTPFEVEDVLFGRLRPYLHKVAFAEFSGFCSPEILVLRGNTRILPRMLLLFCDSDSTIDICIERSAGTRMPRTSTNDLASIEIKLPPLGEQLRISELLTQFDIQISSLCLIIENTKNLRSGLLSDLLSGNHEIPATYDKIMGAA